MHREEPQPGAECVDAGEARRIVKECEGRRGGFAWTCTDEALVTDRTKKVCDNPS